MKKNNKILTQIDQLLKKNACNCTLQALSLLLPSKFISQKSKYRIKADFD